MGITFAVAKKQTCMIVLIREPMPVSRATREASIANIRAFFAASAERSAGGKVVFDGAFTRKVPPSARSSAKLKRSRNWAWWQATKFAERMRYVERIGRGPNRRW